MGTSVSPRSPAGSRTWTMVRATIQNGAPPGEVLAAMMYAASSDEWLTILESPGVNVYAERVAVAWQDMPDQLRHGGAREVVADILEQTRADALSAGGDGVAVALTERALARVLLERLTSRDRETDEPADLPAAWQANRGLTPGELAGSLLVETMRQVASHFFARDAAAVTGGTAIPDARALRQLTRQVGDAAADTAQQARAMLRDRGPEAWADGVRLTFRTAARWRPPGGPV